MEPCLNHPEVTAASACAGCSRPFCDRCLVQFMGKSMCGHCRDLRLVQAQGGMRPVAPPPPQNTVVDHIIPTKNPLALTGYYVGVFSLIPCAGLVLGPAAVILGILGIRARRQHPGIPGQGHAITAVVLGVITTAANWGLVAYPLLTGAFRR